MGVNGNAVRAMFNYMAAETLEKYLAWFKARPDERFCYWSKDEPIMEKDKDDPGILAAHPEIEDINDHTKVRLAGPNAIMLYAFCPRLREAIGDMYDGGVKSGRDDCVHWLVEKEFDKDNFVMTISRT